MTATEATRKGEGDEARHGAHLNLLIAANRFSGDVDQIARPQGLTAQQARVLWVLCFHPAAADGLPMGEIADNLLTRAADTTRLVDRLVAAGFATREHSSTDRRVVRVRATDAGRQLVEQLEPRMRAYRKQFWEPLTEAEVHELNRLLAKLLWAERPTM